MKSMKEIYAPLIPTSSRPEKAPSYISGRRRAIIEKLLLVALLCLALPFLAQAQASDPLAPGNQPTIDENSADYPANVWVTGPLAKVLQNTGAAGTVKWAIVYATQNEIQGFQIHINAIAGAISNYSVTMSDLVNSQTSTHISATSTDVVIYREAYIDVTQPSNKVSATFYKATGYYPDILIPAIDPYFHQTTNAFPFNIAAGNNQSVWVDVHVPPTAPSGYYSGTATLKTGSTVLATLPVVYAVWQWPNGGFMPSTSSLPSVEAISYNSLCQQAYASGNCSSYPGSGGQPDTGVTFTNIDAAVMLLDHRLSVADGQNTVPGTGSFASFITNFGPLLNGTATHNTTTILPGAKMTAFQVTFSGSASAPVWQNWATQFTSNGWFQKLFWQTCDEPHPPGGGMLWTTCAANATAAHSYSNPIIPNLVTSNIAAATAAGGLNGVDILTVDIPTFDPIGGSLTRPAYTAWLSGTCCTSPPGPTRQLWSYQACSSAGCGDSSDVITYPNYNIDGLPVANRAMEWMTFYHQQSGELYYNLDLCFYNASCGVGGGTKDPWKYPYYAGGWGDGVLVYPGGTNPSADNYVGVTTALWLPSLRLKMIRDGMQDYEYLKVLTGAGKGTLVQNEISSWITNSYTFNTDPAGLTAARQALGTALHQITYPSGTSSATPPSALTGTVTV
ncbi:MAG: DUF4091 domain-containing protein, partial [Candidatus Acidiferrales bacterium]